MLHQWRGVLVEVSGAGQKPRPSQASVAPVNNVVSVTIGAEGSAKASHASKGKSQRQRAGTTFCGEVWCTRDLRTSNLVGRECAFEGFGMIKGWINPQTNGVVGRGEGGGGRRWGTRREKGWDIGQVNWNWSKLIWLNTFYWCCTESQIMQKSHAAPHRVVWLTFLTSRKAQMIDRIPVSFFPQKKWKLVINNGK